MRHHATNQNYFAQQGFIRAINIPYLLLALAALIIFYLWSSLTSSNNKLVQLEQSKAEEIAQLQDKIQSQDSETEQLNSEYLALEAENNTLNERVPDLKREASFARATVQRTNYALSNQDKILEQMKVLNSDYRELETEKNILNEMIPDLKREASFARAEVQRSRFALSNQQKYVQKMQDLDGANHILGKKLQVVPKLKKQLSAANAQNARLQHVSGARDNLMRELSAVRLQEIQTPALMRAALPDLEEKLSMAAVEAAKLQDIRESLNDLITEAKKISGIQTVN